MVKGFGGRGFRARWGVVLEPRIVSASPWKGKGKWEDPSSHTVWKQPPAVSPQSQDR
jgi:hypothetical protein